MQKSETRLSVWQREAQSFLLRLCGIDLFRDKFQRGFILVSLKSLETCFMMKGLSLTLAALLLIGSRRPCDS